MEKRGTCSDRELKFHISKHPWKCSWRPNFSHFGWIMAKLSMMSCPKMNVPDCTFIGIQYNKMNTFLMELICTYQSFDLQSEACLSPLFQGKPPWGQQLAWRLRWNWRALLLEGLHFWTAHLLPMWSPKNMVQIQLLLQTWSFMNKRSLAFRYRNARSF